MAQPNTIDRLTERERYSATHAPMLTPEAARQCVTSGRIRLILVVSLMLTLVAFAVIYAVNA